MRAGKLRHRVDIQTETETENAKGELVKAWATVATVWAAVEPIAARERFTAQQVVAEVTHTITLRYRALSPKQRIRHNDRIFGIDSIINRDERNVSLTILAREEVLV